MNILIFILVAYGLTQILVDGRIFNKIRPKHYFFKCAMCVGFSTGIFLWLLSPHTTLFIFDNSIITGFLLGCLSSGTSYFINMLVGDEGIRYFEENKCNVRSQDK